MKIALAQINPLVGDLEGNVRRCRAAWAAARRAGAELVILPELAVPGCHPRDILMDPGFIAAVQVATQDLAWHTRAGPPLLVGTVQPGGLKTPHHPGLYNAAVLLEGGEVQLIAAKQRLRADDVFFEPRWFLPGPALPPVVVAGKRIGVLLGGDLEEADPEICPAATHARAGAEILVCLSASPFSKGIFPRRLQQARRAGLPLGYVNCCGGNDELIYDGRSFGLEPDGKLFCQLKGFEAETRVADFGRPAPEPTEPELDAQAELFQALVLGVADFAAKNRLERAFVGVSGGIDSALVAVIAAQALGAERVTAVAIPSRYTDPRSTACARQLAQALGMPFEVVEMEALHRAAEMALGDLLAQGNAAENLQARLRALILLGYVNRYGGVLLNTSNKTELSLGYGTANGDLVGSLCPIADLTKPEVIRLAHWINSRGLVIPDFTLSRPPSAELRPDQVDPFDYATLSPEMERLVQENRSNEVLRRSENKRWQLGVVLRVSEKAFGTGRLIPITRR
jgi:NAD+ synthase (glutamine-hydrolysing)